MLVQTICLISYCQTIKEMADYQNRPSLTNCFLQQLNCLYLKHHLIIKLQTITR